MRHLKKYSNIIWTLLTVCIICGTVCLMPARRLYAQEQNPVPAGEPANPLIPEAVPVLPEMDPAASEAATDDSLIIVIDPGHGGEGEEGGLYENFVEKELNLIVANAMKAELEKYEGVTVHLTRTGDQKLSLAERSAYAKSVNADFMFCLHFNLSKEHTLFGAECWVSAFGEEYSKGRSFADIEIQMLEEMGLYSRGIKTRLNQDGIDYYGIIRTASELDIPCVLIEHCHMDHVNDRPFCEGREQWEAFGRLDATAAAKYFHLKSEILGVDYSNYSTLDVPVPAYVVSPDSTPPDVCMIDLVSQDMTNGEVTIQLSATDYDSGMLYYAYSYDGGETFSDLKAWGDKSKDTITFTMQVPPHILPQIVVNGYNGYDLYTESNLLSLASMDYLTEEEIAQKEADEKEKAQKEREMAENSASIQASDNESVAKKDSSQSYVEVRRVTETETRQPVSFQYFLTVCMVCALLVLGMVLSLILIMRSRKRYRRRRR